MNIPDIKRELSVGFPIDDLRLTLCETGHQADDAIQPHLAFANATTTATLTSDSHKLSGSSSITISIAPQPHPQPIVWFSWRIYFAWLLLSAARLAPFKRCLCCWCCRSRTLLSVSCSSSQFNCNFSFTQRQRQITKANRSCHLVNKFYNLIANIQQELTKTFTLNFNWKSDNFLTSI